ncbi:unknown protein [Seminavis robusta]|uniref:Uncharacterized protein n=1 Tax=Seminavis robusta TaxID=568900 RepID=A0A9N8DEZ0_9STRA|nr:unknown protein [Seminavis robusta]|eukprot:Sro61_g035240.1 n/a (113) ;mRNA; r:137779-138117
MKVFFFTIAMVIAMAGATPALRGNKDNEDAALKGIRNLTAKDWVETFGCVGAAHYIKDMEPDYANKVFHNCKRPDERRLVEAKRSTPHAIFTPDANFMRRLITQGSLRKGLD